MPHRILETPDDVAAFNLFLGNVKLPVTVEWVQGRDRSKDQNALMWLWATEAAAQRGDQTADDVQNEWKLYHGIPILREDSAEFREMYDSSVKPLNSEKKLEMMRYFPVTRLMRVRQMVRFLDTVQRECLQQGLRLTDPDPMLCAYQERYR